MADQVTVTNWPSAGSKEAVALELWKVLRNGTQSTDESLELFAKCRNAAFGAPFR